MTVFATSYLGSIAYYAALIQSADCCIDIGEHFIKQTARNRCYIEHKEGFTSLSIPIEKPNGKTKTKDIKISYAEHWQHDHWRSITSAYNASPFFMYYNYLFEPFFERKTVYLTDFNLQLQEIVADCLKVKIQVNISESYVEASAIDYRNSFQQKNPTLEDVTIPHYRQVFHGEKKEFIPNLSIIDLLFNEGPDTVQTLREVQFNLD